MKQNIRPSEIIKPLYIECILYYSYKEQKKSGFLKVIFGLVPMFSK